MQTFDNVERTVTNSTVGPRFKNERITVIVPGTFTIVPRTFCYVPGMPFSTFPPFALLPVVVKLPRVIVRI